MAKNKAFLHPDQRQPKLKPVCSGSCITVRPKPRPARRPHGHYGVSFEIQYGGIGGNDPVARATITRSAGEYVDWIDVHKDDGNGAPDEENIVASMWWDHDQNENTEVWHANQDDLNQGEPVDGTTYWGIAYFSAYYNDQGSDPA